VVFDLDGTLYQKRGLARRMFFNAAKDWKLMLAERKTRRALRGKWLLNEDSFYNLYFHTMAGFCDLSASKLKTWYFNRYMPLMVTLIRKYHRPAQWLFDFINLCKQNSVQLVVLSDYGHVAEKLEALGIDKKLFDWVISAPELGGLKPAPQLLLQILEKMKVTPKQCLVIGDREDTDGQLAQSVGALFQLV
jgi:FMN phosphatase YigB (HAD superfamily)